MKISNKALIIFCIFLVLVIDGNRKGIHQNPELVSTINCMNCEYCNIIVYKKGSPDRMKLALLLIEFCKENKFDNIKFATDVRDYPSNLYLNVYLTEKDFENGKQYMNIKYKMKNFTKNSNIRDNEENYQIFIDNELMIGENIQI